MTEVVCLPLDGDLLRTERDPALAYDAGRIPDDDDCVLCLVMRDDLRDWLNEHVGNCKQCTVRRHRFNGRDRLWT
jgi:hypothetical protein